MCSGGASRTGQVPFAACPSASVEKAESWIHSELGAGWVGAWNKKEVREFGILVRWWTSVSGLNIEGGQGGGLMDSGPQELKRKHSAGGLEQLGRDKRVLEATAWEASSVVIHGRRALEMRGFGASE